MSFSTHAVWNRDNAVGKVQNPSERAWELASLSAVENQAPAAILINQGWPVENPASPRRVGGW
jgi:hypothetical protein